MKKCLTLLFFAISLQVVAQTYPITGINISLPANPDANTINWGSGTSMLSITATTKAENGRVTPHVVESKLLVTIKKGGAKICGIYTGNSAPASGFNTLTKVWNGTNAVALLGQDCVLTPGDYEICVQFFDYGPAGVVPLSEEKTKAFSIRATEQQTNPISPISISLPASPDANTANWGSGVSILTITATTKAENGKVAPRVMESKLLVTIKKNGAKICGTYTATSAPESNFNTLIKVWSGSNAVSFLGQDCVLPPGDYEICVQFFGNGAAGVVPLSEEKCKPFSIIANEQQTYQPPQAIAPADGTEMSEADVKKPITFRWIPVIPRPQDPVTYRLTVWRLMQGQTGTQAMKVNQPLITKDVDNSTQVVINNLISNPCMAPYLCSFIWNVQALNREGKGYGSNDGKSGSNQFKLLLSSDVNITSFSVACISYGVYNYTLIAENPANGQFYTNSIAFTCPGGSITSPTFSPVVPGTTISNGSPVTYTGTFNYNGTYPTDIYTIINGYQVGNVILTSNDTEQDSLKACICKDCDNALFAFTSYSITPNPGNNSQFNLAGNINVSGLPAIYGIELQVQSYSYSSTPPSCSNGVTGIEQSGMFLMPGTTINNISAIQVFNETISGSPTTNNNASKDVKLVSTSPMSGNIPVNLLIGLPAPLAGLGSDCCKMNYNVCIRVKVFYDRNSCKSCLFTKCFQFTN